jgi:predicted DNA-binding transcriptional regulator AlpA
MSTFTNARTKPSTDESPHEWLDTRDMAHRFKISARSVLRMADEGRMPWGYKFGQLRRWSRREIEAWEADGCPPVRSAQGVSR